MQDSQQPAIQKHHRRKCVMPKPETESDEIPEFSSRTTILALLIYPLLLYHRIHLSTTLIIMNLQSVQKLSDMQIN